MKNLLIIKQNIPIIIGEWKKETFKVFKKKAEECNSKIVFASKDFSTTFTKKNEIIINEKKYKTDLKGAYQSKNLNTTFAAINELKNQIKIDEKSIRNGIKNCIKNTYFIGRYSQIKNNPKIIFDSAHNEGGITELAHQLENENAKKIHFVYGTVADKDLSKILKILPKSARYYLCKPNIPRGKNELELLELFNQNKLKAKVFKTDALYFLLMNPQKNMGNKQITT